MKRALTACASLLLLLIVAEGGFRLAAGRLGFTDTRLAAARDYYLRGTLSRFEARAHTAFQRRAGEGTNSAGFFDREWKVEREPGVARIICLGASTTEGGTSEGRGASYPSLLRRQLREAGARVEVFKAGISGWTTAEGLVSWFLCLQDYAPDVLVVHFAVNDGEPRFRADFRPDYSHWRVPYSPPRPGLVERILLGSSDLLLALRVAVSPIPTISAVTTSPNRGFDPLCAEGRLDPATARSFVRNVRSIAESARSLGARVVLLTMPFNEELSNSLFVHAIREHNELLRRLAQEEGYLLADAERAFAGRPELLGEFLDGVHLSRKGNEAKAAVVAELLLREWRPPLEEGAPLDDPDEDG